MAVPHFIRENSRAPTIVLRNFIHQFPAYICKLTDSFKNRHFVFLEEPCKLFFVKKVNKPDIYCWKTNLNLIVYLMKSVQIKYFFIKLKKIRQQCQLVIFRRSYFAQGQVRPYLSNLEKRRQINFCVLQSGASSRQTIRRIKIIPNFKFHPTQTDRIPQADSNSELCHPFLIHAFYRFL